MKKLDSLYIELNKKILITEKKEYSKLVNFSENLDEPRHRWFNIKEGFSAKIIRDLIKRFDGKKNDLVFDPFSGSGTTILVSKELGLESFGFEVNPFLAFVGKTKLISEKVNLMKYIKIINGLKQEKNLEPPKLSISKKLFANQLDEVLTIRKYINSMEEGKEKDLLKLAFLCSLEKSSTSKKDGNGLKYPKNKIPIKILESITEKIIEFQNDLNSKPLPIIRSDIIEGDVRELEQNKERLNRYFNRIRFCLFSPPYMNCFDYTEVYKVELWFGDFVKNYSDLKKLRNRSFDSHLNKVFKQEEFHNKYVDLFVEEISKNNLWSKKIPFMIKGYFKDMEKTLKGIYSFLETGGLVVCVVGNSSYGNIAIPTDAIIGDIGLKIGFRDCKIEVARKLGTSSQQCNKVNKPEFLRESLVILKK